MRKPSKWKHPKIKKELFTGSYEVTKSEKQVFVLKSEKGGKAKTFDSYQDAVKLGWKKVV